MVKCLTFLGKCATGAEPKDDGFVATFQLRHCSSRSELGISENPRLKWHSPSRCVAPCNHSGNALHSFTHITSAISRGLADYKAQANLVRKLATAGLMLTGHCPEDLANEFFPDLTRDQVVDGCLLTRTFGERVISSSVAKSYHVIGVDGKRILPTMYRNVCFENPPAS